MPKTRRMEPVEIVFQAICRGVGSRYALGCAKKHAERGLVALKEYQAPFHPSCYRSHATFAGDYLVTHYLRKYDSESALGSVPSAELEHQCWADFVKSERHNADTNARMAFGSLGTAEELIFSARRKIETILGPFRTGRRQALALCDWGPGSTFSLSAKEATRDEKVLERQLSVTRSALPYLQWVVGTDPHWFRARTGRFPEGPFSWVRDEFLVVRGERFSTVPKRFDTRRSISIQPTGNLFLQKGCGAYIRKRLKFHCGIDLDDQSFNQGAAAVAHKAALATLDLKDASNSISRGLVELLLPSDWLSFLDDLRCREIKGLDGEWRRLEMFSAMGNGFTFELETLIFWSLASAMADAYDPGSQVLVYGDDIVVSRHVGERLLGAFPNVGFRVNTDKTFIRGSFFESCGGHYYDGHDVTPVSQKTKPETVRDWISAHNRLHRWAVRMDCLESMSEALRLLSSYARLAYAREFVFRRNSRGMRTLRDGLKPGFSRLPSHLDLGDDETLIDLDVRLRTDGNRAFTRPRRILVRPVTREGDGAALLADWLRRNAGRSRSVSADPTYGLVSPRGHSRVVMSCSHAVAWLQDLPH